MARRGKNSDKKKKLPTGTWFVSTADSFRGGEEDRQGLVAGFLLG